MTTPTEQADVLGYQRISHANLPALYECPMCHALVRLGRIVEHTTWHEEQEGEDPA